MAYGESLLRSSYGRLDKLIGDFEKRGWRLKLHHPTVVEVSIRVKPGQRCYLVKGDSRMLSIGEGEISVIATNSLELWIYDEQEERIEKHKFVAFFNNGWKHVVYLVKNVNLRGRMPIFPGRAKEIPVSSTSFSGDSCN